MRFGKWRGLPLTLALVGSPRAGSGMPSSARADGDGSHTRFPGTLPAYDFTTGGPYMAPPVPYGHYAKDYVADAHKALGCLTCQLHGLWRRGSWDTDCSITVTATVKAATDADGAARDSGAGCGSGLFGHNGGSCVRHPRLFRRNQLRAARSQEGRRV